MALLKAVGLYTFVNELGMLPEGALLQADNVNIDRDGIIEPRRGFNLYGTNMPLTQDRAKQLIVYKNRIIRHFGSSLQFDSTGSGTFSTFSGSYTETETGLRIKSVESNGNLYFTTSAGIKKISANSASQLSTSSNYITNAGGPKALDVNLLITYDPSGFMDAESKVAYRIVWGINDANENLILGSPSARTIITNISTTLTANVQVTFSIPQDVINTNYFYQIYRTAVAPKGSLPSLDDLDPGDEMNLAYEANVTSAELTAEEVTILDISPSTFVEGAVLLYTNPNSGEGILQSNDKPPFAKDITTYQQSVFYANTKTMHKFQFNLLGLADFVSGTSQLIIGNDVSTRKYTFVGQTEITDITTDTKANTTASSYVILYSASNERAYVIWNDTTGSDTEPSGLDTDGKILVRVDLSAAITATDVASAWATIIDGLDDFSSSNVTNTITVNWIKNGNVTDTTFGLTSPGGAWAINVTQQGDGENPNTVDGGDVLLSNLVSPAQAVDETARSLVKIINEDSNGIVYAYYLSGPNDLPGLILLESRNIEDDEFIIGLNNSNLISKFNPTMDVTQTITAISAANPTVVTSVGHGLFTGDEILIFDTDSTPPIDGTHIITKIDNDNFSIEVEVTVLGTTGKFIYGQAISSNEVSPNRVYYSKQQQPEAVPLVNFFDIGAKDSAIKRIIGLRDSLLVFKENSIFLVSGTPGNFVTTLFDSSIDIIAPDTAVVLNNQIFVLTSQGVATVSDTGAGVISRPIENLIVSVTNPNFTNFSTISHAAAYEQDRAYLLWLPTNVSDTYGTQCFRYNLFTRTWTRWTKAAQSAIVNRSQNTLYLGPGDLNYVEKERKAFSNLDYADRQSSNQVLTDEVVENVIKISSVADINIGDVIFQEQLLTIAQLNRLLKKLDIDPSVSDINYFSLLQASAGNDLSLNIDGLALKLDADVGVVDTNYYSSISHGSSFSDIQSDFNIIVNKLNLDTGVHFSNYKLSEGSIIYYRSISAINKSTNKITITSNINFISGAVLILKSINSTVKWAAIHFGQPEELKQISEGTMLFEKYTFSTATVSYASDLSPSFESITFTKIGAGAWGVFDWGELNWGGESNSIPFRTIIPRQKQRCRYMICKFNHNVGLENFAILGISLLNRNVSNRAYK